MRLEEFDLAKYGMHNDSYDEQWALHLSPRAGCKTNEWFEGFAQRAEWLGTRAGTRCTPRRWLAAAEAG